MFHNTNSSIMFNPYTLSENQIWNGSNPSGYDSVHNKWYQSRSDPRERPGIDRDSAFREGIQAKLMNILKTVEEFGEKLQEQKRDWEVRKALILQSHERAFELVATHPDIADMSDLMREEKLQKVDSTPGMNVKQITSTFEEFQSEKKSEMIHSEESPISLEGQVFEEMPVTKISTEIENRVFEINEAQFLDKILANNDTQASDQMLVNGINVGKSDDDIIEFVLGENRNSTVIHEFNHTIGLIVGHPSDVMYLEANDAIDGERVRVNHGVGGMDRNRLGLENSSFVMAVEGAIKWLNRKYLALVLLFNRQDMCAVEMKFIAEFLIKKQMNGVCCNGAKISAYSIFSIVVFVPFDPGGIKFTKCDVASYTTKSVSSQKKAFEGYERTDCTSFIESRTSSTCGEKFWFTERTDCIESYSEKLEVFTPVSDAGRYCMNMNGAHSPWCAKVCSRAYCLESAFANVLIQDINGNTPLMIALSKRNQKGLPYDFRSSLTRCELVSLRTRIFSTGRECHVCDQDQKKLLRGTVDTISDVELEHVASSRPSTPSGNPNRIGSITCFTSISIFYVISL